MELDGNGDHNNRGFILVTGSHRSGTTWVGKVLSAHPALEYIHEPLNMNVTPSTWGVLPVERSNWYQHIGPHNEQDFLPAYRNLIRFRYAIHAALERLPCTDSYSSEELDVIDTYHRFAIAHFRGATALIKDPFAVVSVPWFADRLNAKVVITIRHPAGFVSSLKRLGWSFGLDDFLAQPELMAAHPIPEKDLRDFERYKRDGDEVAKMALGWKHIHRIVRDLLKTHPNLVYVRHRDLALHPAEMFHKILDRLKLPWVAEVEKAIGETTAKGHPSELEPGKHHGIHLHSQKNARVWKSRLHTREIDTIRGVVDPVASEFFTDSEW